MRRVVILGAGFGGLTVASELERAAKEELARVTLIDGAAGFQMGLAAQFMLAGRRGPDEGKRGYGKLKATHVHFINAHATAIDTAHNVVKTDRGDEPYDDLVVATGVESAMELVPGLAEAAHNLCDMGAVQKMKEQLEQLRSGTVVVLVASVPFKCPPAPYEYALLADEILTERGVRNRFSIVVATPEPQPMPTAGPVVGDALKAILEKRGITLRFQQKVREVKVEETHLYFESGQKLEYSVLGAMPPIRAPKVVRDAGLCDASGFVPVEMTALRASVAGVYAIGDVAAPQLPGGKMHPKAGTFAEDQGRAVANEINAKLGLADAEPYSGRGACFVDVGNGMAAPAELNLLAEGGPHGKIGEPSKEGLEAKKKFEADRLARWFD